MRIFGLDIQWAEKAQSMSLDDLLKRLEAVYETISGIQVTPDTAMESPTVQAIVRTISTRIATLPVHVLRKSTSNGRTSKELLPKHPVARLLNAPNEYQDRVSYWLDATSFLVRYGNHYAFKARGATGPIRRLETLPPSAVTVTQEENLRLTYRINTQAHREEIFPATLIHHARGPGRNAYLGDSPVMDVRESIALEIAAERFGASFFGNGAMPGLIFQYMASSQGHQTPQARREFVEEFHAAYARRGRFRAMLLPKGIDLPKDIPVDNDKAQFLETRKLQRTIIAGAWGVPPHLVGDLERATFSNIEQQSIDVTINVVLPYIRIFEASMERDLLTDEDRASGVVIRLNVDAALRGAFEDRQKGLKIQREMGVISPNEWREHEGMNPRTDEGGDVYWDRGPSGQGTAPITANPEENGQGAKAHSFSEVW